MQKRIDYDSPSADTPMGEDHAEDDDSQDIVGSSQASDAARTPLHPRPKKIDFSHYASQRSEPDVEPAGRLFQPGAPASQTTSVFGGTVDRGTPSYSQRYGGYAFSQDEMDFLTPLDQPVVHLSAPTTPSPLKKRHRRSPSVDVLRDGDVQQVTHDMTHMEVRRAGQPLPSISTDSLPSPVAQDPAELLSPPIDAAALGSSAFIANGKRKLARPPRCGGLYPTMQHADPSLAPHPRRTSWNREEASASVPIDTFTNPFAPLPSDSGRKKRPRRKRQSFPTAWIGGGGAAGAPSVSKYLSDFVEQEVRDDIPNM